MKNQTITVEQTSGACVKLPKGTLISVIIGADGSGTTDSWVALGANLPDAIPTLAGTATVRPNILAFLAGNASGGTSQNFPFKIPLVEGAAAYCQLDGCIAMFIIDVG